VKSADENKKRAGGDPAPPFIATVRGKVHIRGTDVKNPLTIFGGYAILEKCPG